MMAAQIGWELGFPKLPEDRCVTILTETIVRGEEDD